MKTFNDMVELRQSSGITQQEIADRMECSRPTIAGIENKGLSIKRRVLYLTTLATLLVERVSRDEEALLVLKNYGVEPL